MIYPTLPVKVFATVGNNAFAEPILEQQPDEKVCPVRLSFRSDKTTVRTDSAASKGHAREPTAQVVILAVPATRIRKESRLELLGQSLRVVEAHPRFTVAGVLDHYELHCDAWV